jgi:predicted ester cyclase
MGPSDGFAIIVRLYEGVNRHDPVAAAACYAEEALNHGVPVGRAGMQRVFESLFAAFPDVHFEIIGSVAQGDRIACRMLMTGTHRGEPTKADMFQGMLARVAPTGRPVRVPQVHEFRVGDGLILEHEAVRDDLALLLQLGLATRPQVDEERRPTRS